VPVATPEPGAVIALHRDELTALCRAALEAAGADRRVAGLLAAAALFAEDRGKSAVGVAHLLDYIGAMTDRRLDGRAVPAIAHRMPAVITSDARGGIAHTGFDESFADLVHAARRCGLAAFAQQRAFTCGQLGWFTERLADVGLVAVATAVSPAMLAAGPGTDRVFGTNPMAYSVPRAGGQPLTVDQASSSTAFVSVREAAARGQAIPEGWAIDGDGLPTTDAEAALAGALLPFGGYKGANIALFVELLSSMAGGNWALDAPPWDSGSRSPSVGMFVLAIDHEAVGQDFPERVTDQLERLAAAGMRVAGARRTGRPTVALRADVVAELRRVSGS
jgi:(2R)-3-sulfolactate dehydrogenase (NADP+)